MVEKLIPVGPGVGKQCQCGRWHSWEDYEETLLCDGCGRVLVMVEVTRRHCCSICRAETTGAPLCDRCAQLVRRTCRVAHEAIAAGACVGSGTIASLRRDEEKLKEYDEWKEARSA